MQVCIYCASSSKIHEDYFLATESLARILVENNVKVVFGGGSSGLMGKLADTVLAYGGRIRGIMPQFMNEVEWGHKSVNDFIYTKTMHERKAKFLEGTDAIIALPGGTGTFEELFEVITLKKLGQFNKPIVILNTRNYFSSFKSMMLQSVKEGFLSEDYIKCFSIVEHPEDIMTTINSMEKWDMGIQQAGSDR